MTALVVIAKQPVPGRVKTRLQPEFSLDEAAVLAGSLIADTLSSARTIRASRHILFYEGDVVPPGAGGLEVVQQPSGTLDERLAAIFDLVDEPMVLIGMDTPQIASVHFAGVFPHWPTGVDAVFGAAEDGGFWALGMREPDGSVLRGVPMSRADTGARQLERLHAAGMLVSALPVLLDVDDYDSACRVAASAPRGAFAATMTRLGPRGDVAA